MISSLILVFIGIYIYRKSLKENSKDSNIFNNPISSDLDKSKTIDPKEAIFLAIALSLDSLCIGIGASISNIDLSLFPILVSTFQILFLSIGTYLGAHINKLCKLPQNIWGLISGALLFFIGILKFFL